MKWTDCTEEQKAYFKACHQEGLRPRDLLLGIPQGLRLAYKNYLIEQETKCERENPHTKRS